MNITQHNEFKQILRSLLFGDIAAILHEQGLDNQQIAVKCCDLAAAISAEAESRLAVEEPPAE